VKQNSQEPEPQHPDDQQPWGPVAGPQGEPVWHPQQSPAMIQRKVVGQPHANAPGGLAGNIQPGSYGQVRPNEMGPYSAPPGASNGSPVQPYPPSVPPAPFIQSAMPMPPQGQAVQPVGTNGADWRRNSAGAATGGPAYIAQGVFPQTTIIQNAPPPEIHNGNIILLHRPNFYLSTVYRPGQRQDPIRKPTGHTTITPKVNPQQVNRVAISETLVMPNVTLHTTKQTRAIPLPEWLEAIIVFFSLTVTFVAHAYNLFNFPRYELDEGTYMSNAWAITQGLISPYPYGYGHSPLGWMQIAAWTQLTGGIFAFGNALNSGRVLMAFYAVGCALLVYLIMRRLSGSLSAALLALVLFSLSPLSITYQREIYLDNIATFWLLLSIYLLVISNSRLLYIVMAAIAFGICILSKEVFLVGLPAMIYAAWLHSTKFQRKFTLVAFIHIVLAICSTFVLLAILKDELFPYSWHLPWDTHNHLSMWDTFLQQAQRGQKYGSFINSWLVWSHDTVFVISSVAAPLFNLAYGLWNRKHLLFSLPPFKFLNRRLRNTTPVPDRHLMLSLLAICFWLLLVRGGQVYPFYIIPLIALIALNAAIALNTILAWVVKLARLDVVRATLLVVAIAAIIAYDIPSAEILFNQDPALAQQQALVWVRTHVPRNAFIVINSYMYVDLRVPGGQGVGNGAPFPHAEVYWNVATDPELYSQTLGNNCDRIDYIVIDSEMGTDIKTNEDHMWLISAALTLSVKRAEFISGGSTDSFDVQVWQVIHKNPVPHSCTAPVSSTGTMDR
jgi:4-amino-4-deoxy-L-arabinose transferase-like glycosyltransferase